MISPYTKYANAMAKAADEAEALADDMRTAKGRAAEAEGATADAIAAGFDNDIADLTAIAEAAREAARVASEQAPADAKFAAAPSPADVKAAQDAVTDAENSGADKKDIAKAREYATNLATEREDAKAEHAGVSRRTTAAFQAIKIAHVPMVSVPTPVVAYDRGGRGDLNGTTPGNNAPPNTDSPSAGGGDTSTGRSPSPSSISSLADTDAGTSLSADGTGAPVTGGQLAGQPQPVAGQQGAMPTGQPQMAPMAQAGAVPSTGAGRLTDPAALAKAASARNRKRDNNSSGTPVQPSMAPMAFGNGSGGTVDRGSSTSGVTTRADTSGSLKTSLSGATLPQGTGNQPGMMARGGMMGGMGGAPGAGGAGGSGASKERPTIYDPHRPDEVERSDSIQSGTLARGTAEDPNAVDERERAK